MFRYSFFRYGLVGFYSLLLDYILLYLLFSVYAISQDIAITIAFFGSSIFNFLMHKAYTFNNKDNNIYMQLLKYILLLVISYSITIYTINVLIAYGLNIFTAKLITVCIVYIYGYTISQVFIFKKRKKV
jgi:putative flippase GtrA